MVQRIVIKDLFLFLVLDAILLSGAGLFVQCRQRALWVMLLGNYFEFGPEVPKKMSSKTVSIISFGGQIVHQR